MPAFRVSSRHAAKMAKNRAAAHTQVEDLSRMARMHKGAGEITRRNSTKLAILSSMTMFAIASISVFDMSPVWIEFKTHVNTRVKQYTSLFADYDHGEGSVAAPRRLSNNDAQDGTCVMDDVSWWQQIGVANPVGAGLLNAKDKDGIDRQYADCIDLEDYMDKGRAGQNWMSGDSTHKGLTTLDCAATIFQFRSETSYQINLCVRSASGGEWYKDVNVETMERIGSPAEKLECTWWRCDELGETKGQGKHCLHCKCGNPQNVTCEPKGEWCKEPCKNDDDKYLYRMSKAACPEICLMSSKMWVLPGYFFGMIYMFIALAIVVDEFFVPALELFCEEMGISDDIAGATFMAAGGSMPELFTSFIGTFKESTVGFATIVGSAVFNVLFVIGVCAFAAEEPLKLTWWPLARDCSFYMVALFLVVLVFGINTPQKIDLWEAMVLLAFYICYCSFMKFNAGVEAWVKSKLCKEKEVSLEDTEDGKHDEVVFEQLPAFNSAIQQFLIAKLGKNALQIVGVKMVTQIKGNGADTFNKVKSMAKNGSNSAGHIVDKPYISEDDWIDMFKASRVSVDNENDIKKAMRLILKHARCSLKGENGHMEMTEDAFKLFYRECLSEVKNMATNVFCEIEKATNDDDATFDASDALSFFKKNGIHITQDEVSNGIEDILKASEEEKKGDDVAKSSEGSESDCQVKPVEPGVAVSEHQFQEWYRNVFIMNEEEEEEEGFTIDLPGEDANRMDWAKYCIAYPISAILYVFLPDVRRSYTKTLKWSVIEFCTSLIWIALFSLLLYEWLLVLCNSIGIPPKVAALTLLAGGTSVPDLLSSYVVAREGKGDMAVSSSIGSNIFDVTVGLPVPWIFYSIVNGGKHVDVVAKSLAESVMLLMIMLALVIGTVMAMKWEMNKGMGGLMMFFYLIFLIFSIAFSPVLPD